jgi:hypothetical protein
MHYNIEISASREGEYVGYCNGVQRIRKGGMGWETYALGSSSGTFVYATAETLVQLGGKLEHIKANTPWIDHKTGAES